MSLKVLNYRVKMHINSIAYCDWLCPRTKESEIIYMFSDSIIEKKILEIFIEETANYDN